MIKGVVDFALKNRFLILAVAVLLFVWGSDLVSQSAGRCLSRRGGQLRQHHHAVAGALGRGHRKADYGPHRDPDGGRSGHEEPALVQPGRHLEHHDELQRRFRQ